MAEEQGVTERDRVRDTVGQVLTEKDREEVEHSVGVMVGVNVTVVQVVGEPDGDKVWVREAEEHGVTDRDWVRDMVEQPLTVLDTVDVRQIVGDKVRVTLLDLLPVSELLTDGV